MLKENKSLTSEPRARESEPKSDRGVTPRVVVLCLLFSIGFGYAIPVIDYKFSNTFLGATHLPPGAIAALLSILAVNPILRKISQYAAFSRNESLTVYLSCLFSCLVPGIGGNNYWVSNIITTFYYATRENRWFDWLKGLPPWMTPALSADGTYDRTLVESWQTGLNQGASIPWGAWIVPMCAWSAFFFASFFTLACLSSMLAAQWNEREALSYPMLRLPLALTDDSSPSKEYTPFFRDGLMWVGFGLAASLQLLNGLNRYFPDVPHIATYIPSDPFFVEAPWNQIGPAPIYIYPIAIGIAFLLAKEVSFSLWSFFWFMKFQLIAAYMMGFMPSSLPVTLTTGHQQFIAYQEIGAYFMFVALIFWTARQHLSHVTARAFGRIKAIPAESLEPMSYPLAFWGFIGGFAFMTAWGVAAGMSFHIAFLLWTTYLVIAVTLSRVIAEGGLLFVHHAWMPLGSLALMFGLGQGTAFAPAHGLAVASFVEGSTIQDYRGNLMPSFMQSFKLAHERGIAARPLLLLIFGVIVVGMVTTIQMNVRLGYENGGLNLQGWFGKWGALSIGSRTSSLLTQAQGPSLIAWTWLAVGMLLTFIMVVARARFAWFPFHPIGYLMAISYPMYHLWFSIMVGWLAKTLINKYGGHDLVRRATPLFLGLVLGDVMMMLFWIIIGGWQGTIGHQLMPG